MENETGIIEAHCRRCGVPSREFICNACAIEVGAVEEHPSKPLKLNMGAGLQKYEGYIGVDIDPNMPACDLEHDLMEPLDLPDGCASHIICSHTLEHLPG